MTAPYPTLLGRSNCLIFAYWQFRQRGGYVHWRQSRWGWWWHFLWSETLDGTRIEHFVPIDGGRPRLFPPLLFKGKILTKDQ